MNGKNANKQERTKIKINKRAFFKTKKKTRNEVVCFNLRRPVSKLYFTSLNIAFLNASKKQKIAL